MRREQLLRLFIFGTLLAALYTVLRQPRSAEEVASTAPAQRELAAAPTPVPVPVVSPTNVRPPVSKLASVSKADLNPLDLLAMKNPRRGDDRGEPGPSLLNRYSHLGLTKKTAVNQSFYRVLSARAVPKDRYSSQLGPVVFEEDGLRVYEDRAPGWQDLRVSSGGQPLMVNPANGHLVIVTGTLKVVTSDEARARALAADEKLQLIQYDASISLAFLKAPEGYALLPAVSRIAKQPGVSLVELEAVEGRAVPR